MSNENIRVEIVDLPLQVKGYTIKTSDGWLTIILNARHSHNQNVKTYIHELKHIEYGDFESLLLVDLIEEMSHAS